MKDRPILFNTEMVRAILDGRKTQTRRICKEMNGWLVQDCREVRHIDGKPFHFMKGAELPICELRGPYGKPGDRLWVRETWGVLFDEDVWKRDLESVQYLATNPKFFEKIKCRPSIHMPRWASRITLEVTDVRVQRIQDISEADASAEGFTRLSKDGGRTYKYGIPDLDGLPGTDNCGWPWSEWSQDPREAMNKLWGSIYPGSWEHNEWVWAYSFRRVDA